MDHLYDGKHEPRLKIIDVFICKLRKKLSQATGDEQYIETVWGRGYKLRDPSAATPEHPWRVAAASSSSVSISVRSAAHWRAIFASNAAVRARLGTAGALITCAGSATGAPLTLFRRRDTSRTASSGRPQPLQWHKPARRRGALRSLFLL